MSNSEQSINDADTLPPPPPSKPHGFAAMPKERQREISRMGGKANKPETRTFYSNRELAKSAGRKGGAASQAARRAARQ